MSMFKKVVFTFIIALGGFCAEAEEAAEIGEGSIVAKGNVAPVDYSAREHWRNPQVFEINREPAHAFALVFPDEKTADVEPDWRDPYAGSVRYHNLNGGWKFHYAERPADAPEGFESPDFDAASWPVLPVPSSWELHGYGQVYFLDSLQPFFGEPRITDLPDGTEEVAKRVEECWIPVSYNPVASYRRTFAVTENRGNRRVILHFGGVSSAFTCWINGRQVGYSQDSFTPAEFDITDELVDGENVLAVQVMTWSDGSYLENQGMPRMSGIFRDVLLIERPAVSIADFHLLPALDADFTRGTLDAELTIEGKAGRSAKRLDARLTLLDAAGKEVLKMESPVSVAAGTVRLPVGVVDAPALWHPEEPNLYTALITLEADGVPLETLRADVGFRRFEWDEEGRFLLNGKRFMMRGVNRHDWSVTNGRTASYDDMRLDVVRMKQLNVNTVRCSHYPNDPRFYALCARYGIAMIDEANLETHRHEVLLSDHHPEWRPQALFRVRNMVMRDRNFPAVIMWSVGNEQFRDFPETVRQQVQLCKDLDPTRGVMAERAWHYKKNTLHGKGVIDFVSPMYSVESRLKWYLKHRENGERRPLFWCEYAHAMGNSMPNLKLYWDLFEKYADEGVNGGCIWDWRDKALKGADGHWIYPGQAGGFENNFNTGPTGVLPLEGGLTDNAKPLELRAVYQQAAFEAGERPKTIRVVNKYTLRNLDEFDLEWTLLRNGEMFERGVIRLDVPPLSTSEIAMPCAWPDDGSRYDLNLDLKLRESAVWAEAGWTVAQGQIALGGTLERPEAPDNGTPLKLEKTGRMWTVRGGSFAVDFDVEQAVLAQYRLNGKELLAPGNGVPGIELNPHSALTDDRLLFSFRKDFKKAIRDKLYAFERRNPLIRLLDESPEAVRIQIEADYLTPPGAGLHECSIYAVKLGGTVEIRTEVSRINHPRDPLLFRLGLRIPLSADLKETAYCGLGPLANYSDRKASARFGVFRLRSDDFYENYLRPQDCGNRGGVEWIEVKHPEGAGLMVVSDKPFAASVMPWTAQEMVGIAHRIDLPETGCRILRLDALSAGIEREASIPAKEMSFSFTLFGKE